MEYNQLGLFEGEMQCAHWVESPRLGENMRLGKQGHSGDGVCNSRKVPRVDAHAHHSFGLHSTQYSTIFLCFAKFLIA